MLRWELAIAKNSGKNGIPRHWPVALPEMERSALLRYCEAVCHQFIVHWGSATEMVGPRARKLARHTVRDARRIAWWRDVMVSSDFNGVIRNMRLWFKKTSRSSLIKPVLWGFHFGTIRESILESLWNLSWKPNCQRLKWHFKNVSGIRIWIPGKSLRSQI